MSNDFPRTALWLRWQSYLWQARRWLRHDDANRIAAHVTWHLNRLAGRGASKRGAIYALKNRLVEHFYKCGLCISVSEVEQHLECWECCGSGESISEGGTCWKCDGTGVYRTHLLYRFVFVVGDRRYVWHQPKSLVRFEVELTGTGMGLYEKRATGHGGLGGRDVNELYYVVLWEYLRQRDYRPMPRWQDLRPRLQECLREDVRTYLVRRRWYKELRSVGRRVRELWRLLAHYLRTGEILVVEDEVPF